MADFRSELQLGVEFFPEADACASAQWPALTRSGVHYGGRVETEHAAVGLLELVEAEEEAPIGQLVREAIERCAGGKRGFGEEYRLGEHRAGRPGLRATDERRPDQELRRGQSPSAR